MKVRVTIDFEIPGGEYEVQVNNISNPGQGMDWHVVQEALYRIIGDVVKDVRSETTEENN